MRINLYEYTRVITMNSVKSYKLCYLMMTEEFLLFDPSTGTIGVVEFAISI